MTLHRSTLLSSLKAITSLLHLAFLAIIKSLTKKEETGTVLNKGQRSISRTRHSVAQQSPFLE